MSASMLISAWLVGALGGLHCLAMCGGFVAAIGARDADALAPKLFLAATTVLAREAAYHGGRVATYAMLGAAFGTAGAMAMDAAALAPLQRMFYVPANLYSVSERHPISLRRECSCVAAADSSMPASFDTPRRRS